MTLVRAIDADYQLSRHVMHESGRVRALQGQKGEEKVVILSLRLFAIRFFFFFFFFFFLVLE